MVCSQSEENLTDARMRDETNQRDVVLNSQLDVETNY
jgi:hypothetical protein